MSVVRRSITKLFLLAAFIATGLGMIACTPQPKKPAEKIPQHVHLKAYYARKPWNRGSHKEAQLMALAGQTIPLATYSFKASKDGQTYSGTIVGTSPFASPLKSSTTNVTVIPLKVT